MYQVSLKSEGGRPFFVITWPGITRLQLLHIVYIIRFNNTCSVYWRSILAWKGGSSAILGHGQ